MARKTNGIKSATAGDPRWSAVVARDPRADGHFFYAVVTTGVYCRPSCASRAALPDHVVFCRTAAEAEEAGFRPCKRCRPDRLSPAEAEASLVAELCRMIEASDEPPGLTQLADHVGRSVSHLHRLFKKATGLTPKAYAAACRAGRVRDELVRGDSVTGAIYGAGFNSSGRFYEQADRILGMTPTAYRSGGAGMEIRFAVGECSLGAILVAATERGICAIALGDDPEGLVCDLEARFPRADLVGGDAEFEYHVARAVAFVETPSLGLDLPLDIRGTAFQQRVWQALRQVPPGATVSYTELAERIGAPKAARAVAGACAANVLAVVIPCHRVVRRDGELSGYRWGVERKAALLEREKKTGEGSES